jgi:hypothetical protein
MAYLVGSRIILDECLVASEVSKKVGIGTAAGINCDRARVGLRVIPAVLQGFPAALEEDALLRINELSLLGQDAKEGCVKAVGVLIIARALT